MGITNQRIENQEKSVKEKSSFITVDLKIAKTREQFIQCQYLVAAAYNRYYKIFFSKDKYDLAAKIEPYPHRFIMATVGHKVVGVAGLYVQNTYIEKFGQVSDADVLQRFVEHDISTDDYAISRKFEITKVVCSPEWSGYGLGSFLWGSANSKAFLYGDSMTKPYPIVMGCAKLSVFDYFYKNTGVVTQKLKAFPPYKVHEYYSASHDPMESRLIIPEKDTPSFWYELKVPSSYRLQKKSETGKLEVEPLM